MQWLEFSVQVPPELVEPVVALFHRYLKRPAALEEPGCFNPDEEEAAPPGGLVTVRGYTPVDRRAVQRRARVEMGFRLLSLCAPLPPLQVRVVEEQEWLEAWKAYARPVRVGPRLVVCPLGVAYDPQPTDVVLALDAGLAFGTGHHPTTRMCLQELAERLRPGMRVLDVGTGTGILALAAAGLGAGLVVAVDKDPEALRAARRNVQTNKLGPLVRVLQAAGPPPDAAGFDLVLANLSARALQELAEPLARTLAPGGVLIASGLLAEQEPSVACRLQEAGLALVGRRQEEDWVALVAAPGPRWEPSFRERIRLGRTTPSQETGAVSPIPRGTRERFFGEGGSKPLSCRRKGYPAGDCGRTQRRAAQPEKMK